MSNDPTRTFSANVGQASVGNAGPDAIEATLDSIISAFLAHKQATDTDHRNQFYTISQINDFLQDITQGAVADNSIGNIKLTSDIKVGSLAALLTADKDSVTDAINELVGSKISNTLLTTQGDIIYASANNTPARLAKGTAGQALVMNNGGTVPEWGDVGLTRIAEVVLSGAQANITFSSIPATYKALKIIHKLRTDQASETSDINIKFNNDSGSTHRGQMVYWINSSTGTVQFTSYALAAYTGVGKAVGNNGTANNFGMGEIVIPNYTEAINKRAMFNFTSNGGSSTSQMLGFGDAYWSSTTAINTISLIPTSGSFVAGSSVILYGIK